MLGDRGACRGAPRYFLILPLYVLGRGQVGRYREIRANGANGHTLHTGVKTKTETPKNLCPERAKFENHIDF